MTSTLCYLSIVRSIRYLTTDEIDVSLSDSFLLLSVNSLDNRFNPVLFSYLLTERSNLFTYNYDLYVLSLVVTYLTTLLAFLPHP